MSNLAKTQRLTGAELFAMGDIGPCELIDGRITEMTPTGGQHGYIENVLARRLGDFVEERGLGWVLTGEVGIYTRTDPDRIRAADVAFVSNEKLKELPSGFLETPPELVAEIISPSDRWQDVRAKIEEYLSVGVNQVWIVEPEPRAVLVYDDATVIHRLSGEDILEGVGCLNGFELRVSSLFTGTGLP